MLRADLLGAKPALDSAYTSHFMLPGITLRKWRDFAIIPPEHGGHVWSDVTQPLVGDPMLGT